MNAPIQLSERDRMLIALRAFIHQRPGLEPRNYGDVSSYRSEMRSITKDLHDARALLDYVEPRADITADMLREAFRSAYSGRLSWDAERGALDYCTGQYFPTEYRKAACAVLASAIWDYLREWTLANDKGSAWKVEWLDDDNSVRTTTTRNGSLFAAHEDAALYAASIARSRCPRVVTLYGSARESIGPYLSRQARSIFGASIANRWFR